MKPTTLAQLYEFKTYVFRNPTKRASDWHKNLDIKYYTGLALRRAGIIKNYGTKNVPAWHWVGITPSFELLGYVKKWEADLNKKKPIIEFAMEKKTESTSQGIVLNNVVQYLTFSTKAGTPINFKDGVAIIEKNGQRLEVRDEDTLVKLVNML